MSLGLLLVFLVAPDVEETAMDFRMQGFNPALEDFG